MDDFSNVKVGDRLWSPTFGWGEVHALNDRWLHIRNCNNSLEYYDNKGVHNGVEGYPQSLFFNKMVLIPSPVPKPKEEVPVTFDPNKPYQRRDGKACKILHTTKEGRLVVVALEADYVFYCYGNGKYIMSAEHPADLINIPEKIEGWVNIYDDYIVTVHSQGDYIASRETADQMASSKRIACIPISFIKGEGLKGEQK